MELKVQDVIDVLNRDTKEEEFTKFSVDIDTSKEITEKFINFKIEIIYKTPIKSMKYDGNTDLDISYEYIKGDITYYKANKFELFVAGYYSDSGNGYRGWHSKYEDGSGMIYGAGIFHSYLLKKYGVNYAKDLNVYAEKKLNYLTSKGKNKTKLYKYWYDTFNRTRNMIKKNEKNIIENNEKTM